MSEHKLPKVSEIVKDIGKIVAVFNGYIEVQGFNPALAYMRIPTHQLKWDEAGYWTVA